MADINNAVITFVGKIEPQKKNPNKKQLIIKIIDKFGKKGTYLIYENDINRFDLVKKFTHKTYDVGDTISFDFNTATGPWFPNIWSISNHRKKEK